MTYIEVTDYPEPCGIHTRKIECHMNLVINRLIIMLITCVNYLVITLNIKETWLIAVQCNQVLQCSPEEYYWYHSTAVSQHCLYQQRSNDLTVTLLCSNSQTGLRRFSSTRLYTSSQAWAVLYVHNTPPLVFMSCYSLHIRYNIRTRSMFSIYNLNVITTSQESISLSCT